MQATNWINLLNIENPHDEPEKTEILLEDTDLTKETETGKLMDDNDDSQ